MIRKNDYYKLGVFIIIGTGMLIAVIIILGAGRYFETTYTMETYFDESVNGLAVGSPVKLRGVKIGRVADISFVPNIYKDIDASGSRYVYVECDINPDLYDDIPEVEFRKQVQQEVKRGLRIRPTSLGLTGQLFLNIVYDDPDTSTPLPINWEPKHSYIPSAPSTLSQVEGAITTISKTLSSLKQDDLEAIIGDVKSIVNTIAEFMKTEGGRAAGNKILAILEETHSILSRTDELLADPAMDKIIPNAAGAAESLNTILTRSADDIIAAAGEARQAMTSFKRASSVLEKALSDPRVDTAMGEIAPTLENISRASTDLTAAVSKVHALVNRLNGVVASETSNVHSILEDTREVMQNIKELTGTAKRYPSDLLFGAPPKKPNPEAP
ncbi:MlaD family protein [Pseudodesulfovibrio portus]|uniref:Glycerophosphoryl diester phosphodiesterase n=1 Tax=Pseudodesulfovibrio portus TaxID=231439 RepID=A0ABM8AV15_9BACT|nr:MlaD family protein [Pseudodesulfovibrio portus]BDQ35331.1 glycerophosphoryl diester phosphodiesterase [Pseudodesulfovibrio portus]